MLYIYSLKAVIVSFGNLSFSQFKRYAITLFASIDFYRSLGAEPMEEWTTFRIAGETLYRLEEAKHEN